jgi:hypothetical protein
VPAAGNGDGKDARVLTWDAKSSGLVPTVKISDSPKNNRILVGAEGSVACKIVPSPDEAVHWSHVSISSFVTNDEINSIKSKITASNSPTIGEDTEKLSVNLVLGATVKDEKPLNITHPAHVTGKLLGETKVTAIVPVANKPVAKVVLLGGATYQILDQFRKSIGLSEFGKRDIYYKEDTPLAAGAGSLPSIADFCANYINAQPNWAPVIKKSTFDDQLKILGVPMDDLIITDPKNPDFQHFDVSWKGKVVMQMQTHVWHLSVEKTILPVEVTANTFTLTVTAINRNQATVVGEYLLVTP